MDTASAIEIERFSVCGEPGTVGMTGDQDLMMAGGPGRKALFYSAFFGVIFRGTGRVMECQKFQGTPEITD